MTLSTEREWEGWEKQHLKYEHLWLEQLMMHFYSNRIYNENIKPLN